MLLLMFCEHYLYYMFPSPDDEGVKTGSHIQETGKTLARQQIAAGGCKVDIKSFSGPVKKAYRERPKDGRLHWNMLSGVVLDLLLSTYTILFRPSANLFAFFSFNSSKLFCCKWFHHRTTTHFSYGDCGSWYRWLMRWSTQFVLLPYIPLSQSSCIALGLFLLWLDSRNVYSKPLVGVDTPHPCL